MVGSPDVSTISSKHQQYFAVFESHEFSNALT